MNYDNVLVPLADLLEAENVDASDYYHPLINEGLRQRMYCWMPFARSTPLFYYNKEKWEVAGLPDRGPVTLDELIEWADLLVERDGDQMTMPYPVRIWVQISSTVLWLW